MPSSGVQTCADRKSTRLNSSHLVISYAVFCLKKKKKPHACGACRRARGLAYARGERGRVPLAGRVRGARSLCRPARVPPLFGFFFFFNDTATTEIYTLSLHDALPIYTPSPQRLRRAAQRRPSRT